MTATVDRPPSAPQRHRYSAVERIHGVVFRLTTTRAVLVTIGVISPFMAYSTYYGYTDEQLPTRLLCVGLLVATCVVGLGSAIVRPNPVSRSSIGFMLWLHSFCRGLSFGIYAYHHTNGISEFFQSVWINGLYVHMIVGYLGTILWARSRTELIEKK